MSESSLRSPRLFLKAPFSSHFFYTAKDPLLQIDSISALRTRARVPALSIDPNPARKLEPAHEDDVAIVPESSASSPSPSMSPRTPADNVPLSASSEGAPDSPLTADGASTTKEPASGPQRTRASSNAAKGGDREPREKRKRSRVTPEQLTHLERFFIADRSPTAARRKEISELLGMQERQTQIWFQNRSAAMQVVMAIVLTFFIAGGRRRSCSMARSRATGIGRTRLPTRPLS